MFPCFGLGVHLASFSSNSFPPVLKKTVIEESWASLTGVTSASFLGIRKPSIKQLWSSISHPVMNSCTKMLPLCCLFTGTDGGIETDNVLSFQWQLIVIWERSCSTMVTKVVILSFASCWIDAKSTIGKHIPGFIAGCVIDEGWPERWSLSCWTRNSAFSVEEARNLASSRFPFWIYL